MQKHHTALTHHYHSLTFKSKFNIANQKEMAPKVGKQSKKQSKKWMPKPWTMQDVNQSNDPERNSSQQHIHSTRRLTENSTPKLVRWWMNAQLWQYIYL